MKYNAPYGVSDPNANYINGNPSTGTMGSIPPAASIEYPQREIVAMIAGSGQSPDNNDLSQLLKAIKLVDVHNAFKASPNYGNASQWSATVPALAVNPPQVNTALWFKPGFDSVVGGTVFSVNGSPFHPVVQADLRPITIGDVVATTWLLLFYNGAQWQIVAGASSSTASGSMPLLQKNADWYVNANTGNDTNYDGTSPTVVSAKVGPFATIQRASNEVLKYNMNNYAATIHIADGNYYGATFSTLNGAGSVNVIGNVAAPGNVNVYAGTAVGCVIGQNGGNYYYDGLRITNVYPGGLDGIDVFDGRMTLGNIQFGPCNRYHMSASGSGSQLGLTQGLITIEANANAAAHIACVVTAAVNFPAGSGAPSWPYLNILGPVNISEFMHVSHAGILQMLYRAIAGAGYVNGAKFGVSINGVLDAFTQGVNYYPGNVAGSVITGGQYS